MAFTVLLKNSSSCAFSTIAQMRSSNHAKTVYLSSWPPRTWRSLKVSTSNLKSLEKPSLHYPPSEITLWCQSRSKNELFSLPINSYNSFSTYNSRIGQKVGIRDLYIWIHHPHCLSVFWRVNSNEFGCLFLLLMTETK